tara:strand:+ start:127 stop:936 length:810 start_codon:yes stop_codon:yes gene_type:complete
MYNRKIKIALCFSGKLGDWESCRESIYQNIITPLKPDIFLSTWDDEDYQGFTEYYNPKKWRTFNLEEKQKTLDNLIFDVIQNPSAGLVPMLYNMYACNALRHTYEHQKNFNYDLIIRIRPDLMVLEQIKPHEIRECAKNPRIIRLPLFESTNIYNHEEEMAKEFSFSFIYDKASLPDQVNDQIAIGSPEAMDKYMTASTKIREAINFLWNEGYPEYMIKVPESVLTTYLKLNNCKYKQLTGTNPFGNINTLLVKDGKKWHTAGHTSIQQ